MAKNFTFKLYTFLAPTCLVEQLALSSSYIPNKRCPNHNCSQSDIEEIFKTTKTTDSPQTSLATPPRSEFRRFGSPRSRGRDDPRSR